MMRTATFGIVADGYERARRAAEERIRPEVEAEFAETLREAPPCKHPSIRRRITREIQRRVREVAPREGLY